MKEIKRGHFKKGISIKRVHSRFEEFIDELKKITQYTDEVKIKAVIRHINDIFDNEVWLNVDKVYETRWDCCIMGG